MKYRDHEKIVNQLEHKYQRQLATLQAKIRRLEHIITLAEDPTRVGSTLPWPTAPVASALYSDYLTDGEAGRCTPSGWCVGHHPAAVAVKGAETIQLMIDILIAVAQKYPDNPSDTAIVGALLWASRPLHWTAAHAEAARIITASERHGPAISAPPPTA